MIILQTERLLLRHMREEDSDFVLELLNTPKWIQYVGDRGIKTLNQARDYLVSKVIPTYDKMGFGFYTMERLDDQVRVGNCGLIRRAGLEHVDIGYSLLPQYEGHGYAYEAAEAVLKYGFEIHKLKHIAAIAVDTNLRSIHLLKKLGLAYVKNIYLPDDEEALALFGIDAPLEEEAK